MNSFLKSFLDFLLYSKREAPIQIWLKDFVNVMEKIKMSLLCF